MKAMYEANVSGDNYYELMEQAWQEAANLFEISIDKAKQVVVGEMHIRKNIENADKKYSGSIFFGVDESKLEKDDKK